MASRLSAKELDDATGILALVGTFVASLGSGMLWGLGGFLLTFGCCLLVIAAMSDIMRYLKGTF